MDGRGGLHCFAGKGVVLREIVHRRNLAVGLGHQPYADVFENAIFNNAAFGPRDTLFSLHLS